MAVEVAVGVRRPLARAARPTPAHMLTDAGAIALSLRGAAAGARGPPAGAHDVRLSPRRDPLGAGQRRDAADPRGVHRLRGDPPPVRPARTCTPVSILVVALVGVVVNLAAVWMLARANRRSLNVEGSFQHILTDLYGFIGTAVAAVVILATGFERADPIVSLLIAALMIRAGVVAREGLGAGVPRGGARGPRSARRSARRSSSQPGVVEVHDLHVWEVDERLPGALRARAGGRDSDCHEARRAIEAMLHERFGARPHDAAGRSRADRRAARDRGDGLVIRVLVGLLGAALVGLSDGDLRRVPAAPAGQARPKIVRSVFTFAWGRGDGWRADSRPRPRTRCWGCSARLGCC